MDIAPDVSCPICLEVLKVPVRFQCKHVFCTCCVSSLSSCPLCRKRLCGMMADHGMARRIKQMKARCSVCLQTIPMSKLEQHSRCNGKLVPIDGRETEGCKRRRCSKEQRFSGASGLAVNKEKALTLQADTNGGALPCRENKQDAAQKTERAVVLNTSRYRDANVTDLTADASPTEDVCVADADEMLALVLRKSRYDF